MKADELFFSLDIGTRTVVGIVATIEGQKLKVLDFEVEEHKKRAMYDGQIHDIESVLLAVSKVREKLESRLQTKLDKVSIAAAGRSLKTSKAVVEREVDPYIHIDKDIIGSLEIEAIQKAQKEMESQNSQDSTEYYCAGYAVVNYYLNGTIISKLEGHRGNSIGVEVISTFLPKIVVDSLYFVINMARLSVYNMTLEPIAAMNVSIHDNFKLLNIALVDIGAGTSDIALTKNGAVYAFAMVPVAGDEITEKIAENYLLDFDTAEEVKISLSNKTVVDFEDIMGEKYQLEAEEIVKSVEVVIKNLAKEIADKILKYNGKAPSAVFLIGGGSLIPNISDFIAEYLELPKNRVGVRNTDIINDIEFNSERMRGPEFITPIGIAVSANAALEKDFLNVTVNNKIIKLLNAKIITVADALIFIGYNPRQLIGRRGMELNFTLNGANKVIKGEAGNSATILINDEIGSLDKEISNGDIISIEPAKNGADASLSIKELIKELPSMSVKINGEIQTVNPHVFVNDKIVNEDYYIAEGDNILFVHMETISDVINALSIPADILDIMLNNKPATMEDKINAEDMIEINAEYNTENDLEKGYDANKKSINVWVNGNQIQMTHKSTEYIFVDIFNYIDIDLKNRKGTLVLKLNGLPANYSDVIIDGDRIELGWI